MDPIRKSTFWSWALTKHWAPFEALRQRYAGTHFEEQRQLHLAPRRSTGPLSRHRSARAAPPPRLLRRKLKGQLSWALTKHWVPFKALHQRYAGTRFEEQRQLHLPQKHKATGPDSSLRVEMNNLETKLTTPRPATSSRSPRPGQPLHGRV